MISVRFQGKPLNITVIQAYAPTSNAEEAEGERLYEDLQDLLELTPPKNILFICQCSVLRKIRSNKVLLSAIRNKSWTQSGLCTSVQ